MQKKTLIFLWIIVGVVVLTGCIQVRDVTVSGKITEWDGTSIADVAVRVTVHKVSTHPVEPVVYTTVTDSNGNWSLVIPESKLKIEVAKDKWAFTPMEELYAIDGDRPNLNFIGTLEEPVQFADATLENIVRQQINKPTGQLMVSDVIGIKTLDAVYTGVTRLEGLENLFALRDLMLNGNPVSDLTPLRKLKTNLALLSLNYTSVKDFTVLKELNLKGLAIEGNELSEISFLGDLTSLQGLNISHNQISNLQILNSLPYLDSLMAGYNQINDFRPLSFMHGLIYLNLSGSKMSNLNDLASLTNLTLLDLSLTGLTGLSDISALANLHDLTTLNLAFNEIKDITNLSGLINLRYLNLRGNTIKDFSPLENLTALKILDLNSTLINDLKVLTNLREIRTLDLGNNGISSIGSLSSLQKLQMLTLSNNPIKDISVLENFPELVNIDMDTTLISDISVLLKEAELHQVSVQDNPSLDISRGSATMGVIQVLRKRGVSVAY